MLRQEQNGQQKTAPTERPKRLPADILRDKPASNKTAIRPFTNHNNSPPVDRFEQHESTTLPTAPTAAAATTLANIEPQHHNTDESQ